MRSVAAQEIKRRGVAALDEAIKDGPVHVIKNNQPLYVVLTEERYRELLTLEDDARTGSIRASLEDLKRGRVRKGTAADLLKELGFDG